MWSRFDAWAWFPRQKWVYNKLSIAESQGLECGPHGLEPPAFVGEMKRLLREHLQRRFEVMKTRVAAETLRVAARPETVWRYWTDPDRMREWWGRAMLDPNRSAWMRIAARLRTSSTPVRTPRS